MKKTVLNLSLIIAVILTVFTACTKTAETGIEITSCELFSTENGVSAKFEVLNREKVTIDDLSLSVVTYDENGEEKEKLTVDYPLYVESEQQATMTLALSYNCEKVIAVSYSYKTDGGEEKNGNFENPPTAVFKPVTTADTKIETREELSQNLIEDVKRQFMLQNYEAHGYYDSEKNQFVIAAYATKTYSDCYYSYQIDTAAFSALADSIAQMSLTCYEEFQNHNFMDVQVSIGLMSSDEKIMISATNGEIVEMFN